MNNNNQKVIVVVSYPNAEECKSILYKENKGKSGLYRWNNLITGKSYIGSDIDLSKRFRNYYKLSYLESSKSNSIIYSALLKHGYSNFSLDILEYCESSIIIKREQYYIDNLNPDYNILKVAGSRLGSKHSEIAKVKMSVNNVASPLRKMNHLLATGHITTVVNKKNNSVKLYNSVRIAARDIGVRHGTLLNYMDKDKLLKGIYLITRSV